MALIFQHKSKMSFSLVGTAWNLAGFESYLVNKNLGWADSVTLHHTGSPDLSNRREGLILQHIRNIQFYYEKRNGWSRGPHLFVDDVDVNGMSPLTERGIHAVSFNSHSIGVEVLGNYDEEDPKSGRGLKCWIMAAKTTAILLKRMGLEANEKTILFHRDDPKTRKSCPGDKVEKAWVISLVRAAMADEPAPVEIEEREENERMKAIEWQMKAILKENADLSEERWEELEERLMNIDWQVRKILKGEAWI